MGKHRRKPTRSKTRMALGISTATAMGLSTATAATMSNATGELPKIEDTGTFPSIPSAAIAAAATPTTSTTTPTTNTPSTTPTTTTTPPNPTTTSPNTTTKSRPSPIPRAKPIRTTTQQAQVRACGEARFNGVRPHVAEVGNHIAQRFNLTIAGIIGLGSRGNVSDHPTGLALDFMVNKLTGDALADYVLRNADLFNVTYVIWRQRINYGSGWQLMRDRGSYTANHMDHVHVSFARNPTSDFRCS